MDTTADGAAAELPEAAAKTPGGSGDTAAAVPGALAKGKPGSAEFRAALRDSMEAQKNVVMTHGIANMTADDHNGFDSRARVMVTIEGGAWKLLP